MDSEGFVTAGWVHDVKLYGFGHETTCLQCRHNSKFVGMGWMRQVVFV